MATVVSIHSFRGGTGKSNTASNVAAQLATAGHRVAVVDTDIQSPGVHVLFGFDDAVTGTLNDFLWGERSITDAAHDVTASVPHTGSGAPAGKLYLVPSSMRAGDIARVLREGYDVGMLNDGFRALVRDLDLDFLMIDTHPGLNEETLLSIAVSDVLLLVLRPDRQDFQGTAVTVDVARRLEVPNLFLVANKVPARRLEVPNLFLVANKVPSGIDGADLEAQLCDTYGAPTVGVLPLTEDVAINASAGLFSLSSPEHPWSAQIRRITEAVGGLR